VIARGKPCLGGRGQKRCNPGRMLETNRGAHRSAPRVREATPGVTTSRTPRGVGPRTRERMRQNSPRRVRGESAPSVRGYRNTATSTARSVRARSFGAPHRRCAESYLARRAACAGRAADAHHLLQALRKLVGEVPRGQVLRARGREQRRPPERPGAPGTSTDSSESRARRLARGGVRRDQHGCPWHSSSRSGARPTDREPEACYCELDQEVAAHVVRRCRSHKICEVAKGGAMK
jgi:hypothetical protein